MYARGNPKGSSHKQRVLDTSLHFFGFAYFSNVRVLNFQVKMIKNNHEYSSWVGREVRLVSFPYSD